MEYSNKPLWYILHTYAGFENKVVDSLHKLIESNNLEDKILDIQMPLIDEFVEKNGKKKVVQRKKFPTYVYVKAILDNELWFLITNIGGATGFCGPGGRAEPITDAEVKRLGFERIDAEELDMAVGDAVKIINGPFATYTGIVDELNFEKQRAKVSVELFGKSTPMELEFKDVEKIHD